MDLGIHWVYLTRISILIGVGIFNLMTGSAFTLVVIEVIKCYVGNVGLYHDKAFRKHDDIGSV